MFFYLFLFFLGRWGGTNVSLEMDIFLSHFCAKNGIFSIGKCLWFQLLLSVEGLFLGFFLLNKIFSFESCREKAFFFWFPFLCTLLGFFYFGLEKQKGVKS